MKHKRKMLFSLLILLASCGQPHTADKQPAAVVVKKDIQQAWVMDKASIIDIKATSSMMNFNYQMKNYAAADTLIFTQKTIDGPLTLANGSVLKLPVKRFENANTVFTDIFRKSVKAGQYPDFILKIDGLPAMPQPRQTDQKITADIELTVAGKTKSFAVDLKATRTAGNLRLTGIQKCKFSDFGLQPPTKVFGVVDVDNNLSINIDLKMASVNL